VSQAEIQSLLQSAGASLQRGDGAGAAQYFEHVLELDPTNPHALNSLGVRALDAGEAARAEALFRRATLADPKEPALWLNVAKAQRLQEDDEGERASLSAALALDQRNFMALLRKAELHERLVEAGEAAQAWSGVVSLAAQAENLPHGILAAVAHGQAFLANHSTKLGDAIDAALVGAREGLSARELRRFDAARDAMLGKRRVYHNEPHGLHFPFLPAEEFFDRKYFPWMASLEAQTAAIREEFRALVASGDAPFRPYVAQDAGTPQNLWTPLDHSLDWSALFLWEYGIRNDEICARCPATAAALAAVPQSDIPARAPTAFFSLLKPRTHIPPHTGVTNVRTIIHLPLIVPENCRFRVGGETRIWREGEAFAFDDTIEHEAWNDSDEMRAVLIFDVWNPWLTDAETGLLRQMFAASDASGLSPNRETGAGF
jgi:aspartate beta-hydroxylase